MLDWIQQHSEVLTLATQVGTLLVWLFYAQLLFNSYRRQRRPKIIINQGVGTGLDSRCLVSNMSEEAIFVEAIIARLETSEGEIICPITDYEHTSHQQPRSLRERTGQGPMKAGEYLDLGSFRQMIDRTARSGELAVADGEPVGDLRFYALEVSLIAIYGSEDHPVGARRRFILRQYDYGYVARPATIDTIRLSSRRNRRELRRMLEQHL